MPNRSPSALTVDLCEAMGYHGDLVERTLRDKRGTKKDWCGFADFIYCHPHHGFRAVLQVTSDSNVAARVKKCKTAPGLAVSLQAGATVEVWGWSVRRGISHLRRVRFALSGDSVVYGQVGAAEPLDEIEELTV